MKKLYTYSDLDIQFEQNPISKDLQKKTDEKAIRFALKSLIMTNFYEKPFQPEYGGNLSAILFDNFTANTPIIISQLIMDLISNYEPRIIVMDVNVVPNDQQNSISIQIKFRIRNTERVDTIGLSLKRTR